MFTISFPNVYCPCHCCCWVTQPCPTLCDPIDLQQSRSPHLSASPKVCPNSRPLHQWCHQAISSSDTLFSFSPPSFPASGTFLMSWLFVSNDQITGVLASESVFPMSIEDWVPLRLTGLISLQSKGLSGVFSSTTVQTPSILWCLAFITVQLSQLYVITGETTALTIWIFVGRAMSLLFNTLSRFVISFLPRSNCLLISLPQSPSAVISEPKKKKSVTLPPFPFYLPWSNGAGGHDLSFF